MSDERAYIFICDECGCGYDVLVPVDAKAYGWKWSVDKHGEITSCLCNHCAEEEEE